MGHDQVEMHGLWISIFKAGFTTGMHGKLETGPVYMSCKLDLLSDNLMQWFFLCLCGICKIKIKLSVRRSVHSH